jgi:hypothetical protein
MTKRNITEYHVLNSWIFWKTSKFSQAKFTRAYRFAQPTDVRQTRQQRFIHQLDRMIKMHVDAHVDGREDMRIRSAVQC